MLKIYMALIIIGLLSSAGAAGYWYYTDTQKRLIQLRENNIKLQQAAETLQHTVETMERDAARDEELNRELTGMLQNDEAAQDKLRSVLSRLDLAKDAREDPNGLEERIDAAVKRLIQAILDETTTTVDPSSGASAK